MTGAEAAVIAGLVGGGSAVLAAGIATIGTYKVTNRSITAEVERAREERLAEAYIDLMWLVHSVMAWVEITRPRVHLTNQPDPPSEISYSDETQIKARVQAIGTTAVRDRLALWRAMLTGFRLAVGELDAMAGGPGEPKPPDLPVGQWLPISSEMNERREALRELTIELEIAVRRELVDEEPKSA